jgi:hypothetical protein
VNDAPNLQGTQNTTWYRTSLGEVAIFLTNARNKRKFSKGDYEYLSTCLYISENRHKIGSCDPAIFEILKHTTKNG